MSEKYKLGPVTAYGIAVEHGFQGTEQEWLDSLHPSDAQIAAYFEANPDRRVADGSVTRQKLATDVNNWIGQIQSSMTDPFNFKGIVEDTESLPADGNTVNDTYYVEDENANFSWNGEDWFRSGPDETQYLGELNALKTAASAWLGALPLQFVPGAYSTETGGQVNTDAAKANNQRDDRAWTVSPGEVLLFGLPQGMRITVFRYDDGGTYIARSLYNATDYGRFVRFEVPSGTEQLRFSVRFTTESTPISSAEASRVTVGRSGSVLERFARVGNMTSLTNGTDLDTVVEPGVYYLPSTFTGSPVGPYAFLFVDKGLNYVLQEFVSGFGRFWRYYTVSSGVWTSGLSDGYQGSITSSMDFNDLRRGIWYKGTTGTRAKNQPTADIGWLEYEGQGNRATGIAFQRFTTAVGGKTFVRHRSGGGAWGDWIATSGLETLYVEDAEKAARISRNLKAISQEWTAANGPVPEGEEDPGLPEVDGMPETKRASASEWNVYNYGDTVSGLPYSSVLRFDGDIFFNRSLTTFHSAVRNPVSILYTAKAGTPDDGTAGTQAAVYGCACSSFASAAVGSVICRSTASLMDYCVETEIGPDSDLGDLQPGMLLLKNAATDHTILIKSVRTLSDGSTSIVIMESTTPLTRERTYQEAGIRKLLRSGYGVYEYPDPVWRRFVVEEFAEDVIPEYGCDTWYKLYDSGAERKRVVVWIPHREAPDDLNAEERAAWEDTWNYLFYRKEGSAVWSSLSLEVDGEIVKDRAIDITSYLTGTGVWELTTDPTHQLPVCHLVIADGGNADVLEGTFALRDYAGCVPEWYMVLRSDREYASAGKSGIVPDSRIIAPELNEGITTNYFVRVYFNTGYGRFHKDFYPV